MPPQRNQRQAQQEGSSNNPLVVSSDDAPPSSPPRQYELREPRALRGANAQRGGKKAKAKSSAGAEAQGVIKARLDAVARLLKCPRCGKTMGECLTFRECGHNVCRMCYHDMMDECTDGNSRDPVLKCAKVECRNIIRELPVKAWLVEDMCKEMGEA